MPVYERLDHRDVEKLMKLVNKLQRITKDKNFNELEEEDKRNRRGSRFIWPEVEEICRKAEETVRRDPMVVNRIDRTIMLSIIIGWTLSFLAIALAIIIQSQ